MKYLLLTTILFFSVLFLLLRKSLLTAYWKKKIFQHLLYLQSFNTGEKFFGRPASDRICRTALRQRGGEEALQHFVSGQRKPLRYLLKKAGILLSQMKCTLSFTITIINNYNQKFVATVYIDIPLEDSMNNTSIYDGKIVKNIENTNLVKFVRVE